MGMTKNNAPKVEMCHEGMMNLIRGIVNRAKYDFLRSAPDSVIHKECEEFFLHPVFDSLTGMDGKMTLKKLQEQYEQKRQKKRHKEAECYDNE